MTCSYPERTPSCEDVAFVAIAEVKTHFMPALLTLQYQYMNLALLKDSSVSFRAQSFFCVHSVDSNLIPWRKLSSTDKWKIVFQMKTSSTRRVSCTHA